MSIDLPAELLTASSGSAGDTVFSRNQHGPYTRPRTAPIDPGSARQLAVRAALSQCVTAWNTTLTQAEREAWDRYALACLQSSPLGRRTNVGGLDMYVRSNVPRIQAAEVTLPRVDVAPWLFDLGSFTPLNRVVLNVIDDTLHPVFDDTDPWVTEAGAAMLFYLSALQPLTRNFWAGPYRFLGSLLGSDPTLSSPATFSLPVPAGIPARAFVRGRVTRSDGRLSHSFRLPADIDPQVPPVYTGAVFDPLGGAPVQLTVSFDTPIRDNAHTAGSWLWRYSNRLYYPFSAVTDAGAVVLLAFIGPVNVGPNVVRYAPAIPDVYGLLTGIAVLSFTQPF